MNFIEIKNRFIALNRVRYIDYDINDDGVYYIMFQFEMEDNFTIIYFEELEEYEFWLRYLRNRIKDFQKCDILCSR